MATVQITNVSPLGDLDVPILGRVVARGETIDVDADIAGRVLDPTTEGDVGTGLLAQAGTWASVVASTGTKKTSTPPADTTPPVTTEGE